jgi:hypothetical protein
MENRIPFTDEMIQAWIQELQRAIQLELRRTNTIQTRLFWYGIGKN